MTFLLNALVVVGAGSLALMPYGFVKTHENLVICEAIILSVLLIMLVKLVRPSHQTQPQPETDLELGVATSKTGKREGATHIGYVGYL